MTTRQYRPGAELKAERARRWAACAALGAVVLGAAGLTPASAHGRTPEVLSPFGAAAAPAPGDVLTPEGRGTRSTRSTSDGLDSSRALSPSGTAVRQRAGTIRDEALAPICGTKPGQEVRFPLFDDVLVKAVETGRETVDGHLIWRGEVPGTTDQTVLVTLTGGCDGTAGNEYLGAQFALGGALFDITATGPGKVVISETTPLVDEHEQQVVPPRAVRGAPGAGAGAGAGGMSASEARDPRTTRNTPGSPGGPRKAPKADCKGGANISVVDTLVAYTPKARAEAGGDAQIRAQAVKGVSLANEAFSASGIDVRLRLVYTTPVDVPAAYDTVSGTSLAAFAKKGDGIADTLPALRDQYGADQVSVIAGGTAAGGIGYIPAPAGPAWAEWTYTVVAQSAIATYSFGHEIGHNLGSNHDWTTDPGQPDNGASGYFPAKGDFSTLMAYESSCRTATKGGCGRVNRFSNSSQNYRGLPLGKPMTQTDSADSAAVLGASGKAVAAYRTAVTDDSLCGVTTSVSPAASGTVAPETPGPYAKNATVYFTATPAKGYVFDRWMLDGKQQTSTATRFAVTTANDRVLQAVFKKGTTPTAKVTTKSSGSGTVKATPTKKSLAAGDPLIGTDLLYEAVPAAGWSFAGWKLSSGSYAGDLSRVGVRVGDSDQGLEAVFAPRTLTLELCPHGHGTLTAARTGKYAVGDTAIVTARPAKGHVLAGWLLDGRPYAGSPSGEAIVSFSDGHSHTLKAKFRKK
ncbi:reprolysin-like metallopeptidase [Streptomyces sp. NPDC004539]|uniref:InlB B-repeat-containing protein n=1 Tax=Streptomyces sp. NPDC004539 TaxID=3154280 RepID=UPI0033AF98FD